MLLINFLANPINFYLISRAEDKALMAHTGWFDASPYVILIFHSLTTLSQLSSSLLENAIDDGVNSPVFLPPFGCIVISDAPGGTVPFGA